MLQVAPILTNSGESLQIRSLVGEQIIFTHMKIGSGTKPSGQSGKSYTDLITPKLTFDINSIEVADNYARVIGSFDTTDISSDFKWTEFGIFCAGSKSQKFSGNGSATTFTLTEKPEAVALAKVSGTIVTVSAYNKSTGVVTLASAPASGTNNVEISYPDSTEQLYGYSYDDGAGMLRTGISDALAQQVIECVIAIGDAENVTAILSDSSLYARKSDFEDHVNDTDNPHQVTAEQLGIDADFLNGSVNDLKVTYEEAENLAPLTSGEKLFLAFSKLAKAVSSLIAHLADMANPHNVTYTQVGAAAASHTHTISQVSGTVPVSKGGTGNTSVDTTPTQNSTKMVTSGAVFTALAGKAASSHTHAVADITGVLPVAKGGTGQSSVDTTPTQNSSKMVTSGGVFTALAKKSDSSHNHDDRYTTASSLTTLLAGKADSSHNHSAANITSGTLPVARGGTGNTSVDTTPTSGSTKMVTSGGVYSALAGKADSSHTHGAGDINSGTLPVARGGTGQTNLSNVTVGEASQAVKLKTARNLKVALNSTTAKTFDGSANVNDIPVSGVLPEANGGTGVSAWTGTDYTTSRPRAIAFASSTPSSVPNGRIVMVYA